VVVIVVAIRGAIGRLAPWQFVALVAGLLVRQLLNALPLACSSRGARR
jgi:hypothetical protein